MANPSKIKLMDYKYFYRFCLYVSEPTLNVKNNKTTTHNNLTMVVPYRSDGEG